MHQFGIIDKVIDVTMCVFGKNLKTSLFYYSAYFLLLFMVSLRFLVLFMDSTVLFQLTFTFIYNIFNKQFSVLAK